MDKTSAGVKARWVFNGLPFGVVGLFRVKADESDAPIRMLGEISPRTRLEDTLSGDWDTSLAKGASSADSAAVDKVVILAGTRFRDGETKNTAEKIMGRYFEIESRPPANYTRWG